MRESVIDLSKEYGLVLEGGGAKGAYQIGAWKALCEAGVKINAVAGTSVGALNGALICMGELEKAEEVWNNISYSKVMDVDDNMMEALFNGAIEPMDALKNTMKLFVDGGADITPLKELIHNNIDEEKIREGNVNFYILTFSISDRKELDIDMKEVEEGRMEDLLLASSYLPVFKSTKLHGKTYMDGGMFNNVPLESLVKRDYKNIIMLRIFGIGREKHVKVSEDTTIYNVEPRVDLGSILDFSPQKSKRNMKIGYYDAMRMIYGLEGKIYYLEQLKEEWYYSNKLINMHTDVIIMISKRLKVEVTQATSIRVLFENILPAAAATLKLGKDWNYAQLFVAMLEATAKLLRVPKYQIYTVEAFQEEIRKRAVNFDLQDDTPIFACIIINLP